MRTEQDLWAVSDYLFKIPHRPLLPSGRERRLSPVDDRLYRAGLVGAAR